MVWQKQSILYVCVDIYVCLYITSCLYSSPPLSMGDMFQNPKGMPETTDSTEPYTCILCFLLYIHTYDKVYKLAQQEINNHN